ncbi:hypothetical protein H6A65_06625 [Mediterraneibacter glycyrrhizinilyticus]|uniref:hypothetical protein n=1 Tax=Mediterraneibacter glycyrrhizinilyticus TaxID=342942 RepID=UPI001961005F|nr:hypothetical protein [Mediterraneibacter glycyrrhizinilyticus]MBM6751170.1 hypothetical protein [Mediterraneibacter glycyrrhizinilyticus]
MEWCEERYRETGFEEFVRRGVRTILVLVLFLSLVMGVEDMTLGKELSVIHDGYGGAVSFREEVLPDVFKVAEDAASLPDYGERTEPAVILPDKLIYEKVILSESLTFADTGLAEPADTVVPDGPIVQEAAAVPEVLLPTNDIQAADDPVTEFSGNDISVMDEGSRTPASDISVTEDNVPDIPVTEDDAPDIPASDLPGAEVDMPDIPETKDENVVDQTSGESQNMEGSEEAAEGETSDTEEAAEAGTGVSGFIVDESGMIRGISDISLAVSDMCLYLPAEGCAGIASGAFSGVTEEIVDVYIPSSITNIEEGAFLGLPYVCKYEVEPGNSMYYTENGVLFADGGACLLAFPAGRIGTYSVPAAVIRFADNAFTGSSLSKLDIRSCTLEDTGNLPESISVQ